MPKEHKTYLCLSSIFSFISEGPSWPWSYGSWICIYLCN